jgi:hypothetical protein
MLAMVRLGQQFHCKSMPQTDTDALTLLTSQRNLIFATIQSSGFSPKEFEWETITRRHGRVPLLRHTPTGYYFLLERVEQYQGEWGFAVTYSPGQETLYDYKQPGSWSDVPPHITEWLDLIKRETEVPDLWEALSKDTQLIQDTDDQPSDNLRFTETELPSVRKALAEIQTYILKTHDLTEVQRRRIGARFDYLDKRADEFGRKDWMMLVLSTLLAVGVDELRNGDSTRHLFAFAREVFKQLLGTVLYLAGPH